MNPFAMLDRVLMDWASPRVRRLIHALLALGAFGLSIYLASDGDWWVAAGTIAATIYAYVNKANTPAAPLGLPEPDDDSSYEEAGGQPFPEDGLS